MNGLLPYLMTLFLSLGIVRLLHPYLVELALKKGIVDNPNSRRLNKTPVPVLGGVGVFLGFAVALYLVSCFMNITLPNAYIVVLSLMVGVGFVDDLYDLKPGIRFGIQILAVLLLYFVGELRIGNSYTPKKPCKLSIRKSHTK